jgi:hypothetical protein
MQFLTTHTKRTTIRQRPVIALALALLAVAALVGANGGWHGTPNHHSANGHNWSAPAHQPLNGHTWH